MGSFSFLSYSLSAKKLRPLCIFFFFTGTRFIAPYLESPLPIPKNINSLSVLQSICIMLCRKSSIKATSGSVPVHLNVYDLTPINGYSYWLGLGVYHSGVEVHGVEYAFGAHEYPTTGIFEGEPRHCDGFAFRKAILIGWTEMGPAEVRRVMEGFADVYKGNAYNLITKNCNHFCNHACLRLTGNPIPSWVNRLARIGFICHCIVPVSLNTNKVRHHRIEDKVCETTDKKKQLASNSNRFTPSTASSSSSSSSSPPRTAAATKNRSKCCSSSMS